MLKSLSRANLANSLENLYLDAHSTGAAILDGATWAESLAHLASQERQSKTTRLAANLLTATRIAVHAVLFTLWAPATAARNTAHWLLRSAPANP